MSMMEVEEKPLQPLPTVHGQEKRGGPRVAVLDEDGKRMRFVIGGVHSSFVNALRRTIMGEVDTMAIDQLEIHQNTTMMHDELLYHRLGLIPLAASEQVLDQFVYRHECDCEDGCPHCMAKFTLHVVNRSDETVEVTTSDLRSHHSGVVASPGILLVKLGKNQELSFSAYAVKSTSRYENNAKWNPVSIASYRPVADVRVDSAAMNKFLTPQQQQQVCEADPGAVLQYDPRQGRTVAHPDAGLRCTYSGEFIETLGDILHSQPLSTNTVDQKGEQKGTSVDRKDDAMAVPGEEAGLGSTLSQSQMAELTQMEEAVGRVTRHPNDLVHPFISMVPMRDQFLFPVVSTGCMPPRTIVLRALTALRRRLLAIQMLNSRQKFFDKPSR